MAALTQQTDEWLEARRSKIGASDAPVIMEVSPWKTPYQLWQEKVGLSTNNFVSPAMQNGIDKEPEARTAFMKKTDILVFPRVVFHERYDWMMASLDGMDPEGKHIVEIKTVNADDHALAESGKIPEKYFPQLQHQLEVTGLDMAYYFSYHKGEGIIVEVGRDDKYIEQMVDEEKKFYTCMQDFIAPKMTTKDYVEIENDDFCSTAVQWQKIQQELSALTKQEEMIKKKLIYMCEAKQYTNVKGAGIRLSKCMRKGNIEYTKIPCLKRMDLEIFRKEPTQYWRVTNGEK